MPNDSDAFMTKVPLRRRDRILMLGRRKAGKTVFLARLYEQAWRGVDGLHMRAAEGAMHELCMEIVEQLRNGNWPAATAGSLCSEVEVSWHSMKTTMQMLDYPGEVFRQAFVDGGGSTQADELLDHLDHAAAVILLVDPGNIHAGTAREVVDDDYGMVKAVDYLRQSVGGDQVPVAVALTKCDEHVGLIRSAGGARAFIESKIPNLVQYGGRMRMFATAAVRTRSDAVGRPVPNTQHEPAGLSDALKYCLKHVGALVAKAEAERKEASRVDQLQRAAERDRRLAQQSYRRWIGFWIGLGLFGVVVIALALIITYWEQPLIAPVVESRPQVEIVDSPAALPPSSSAVEVEAAPPSDGIQP